jgi:hypothetical protein
MIVGSVDIGARRILRWDSLERMFPRKCSFDGCDRPFLAKGACSAHYKQLSKGQPLRPLRPFYGKVRPYGPIGPCRFNDLPQVHSGEVEEQVAPSPVARTGTTAAATAQPTINSCGKGKPLTPLYKGHGFGAGKTAPTRGRGCIIETGRGTIIVRRISNSGLEVDGHPELESLIW